MCALTYVSSVANAFHIFRQPTRLSPAPSHTTWGMRVNAIVWLHNEWRRSDHKFCRKTLNNHPDLYGANKIRSMWTTRAHWQWRRQGVNVNSTQNDLGLIPLMLTQSRSSGVADIWYICSGVALLQDGNGSCPEKTAATTATKIKLKKIKREQTQLYTCQCIFVWCVRGR